MRDNKLIAEFMGLSGRCNGKYDKSWDWLMPVVEECRLESRCKYNTDDAWDKIHWALEECNMDKVYKAVVEFIKQHNKE